MPVQEMRTFEEITPPIIESVSERERKMYVTCEDEEKIDKAYDVYIVGWINDYYSQQSLEINKNELIEERTTFKVLIGEPYWMVFNTQPTVDWIPRTKIMDAGTTWKL